MKVVRYAALMLVASALPALAQIHYAPTVQHYRLHSVVNRSQQVQGQKTDFQITNDQLVTVTIQNGVKDTLRFAVSLDSTNMTSTLPVQLPDVASLQGTKVSGAMLSSGKVVSFKSESKKDDGLDRKSVIESMAHFLLALPAGATSGSHWTDTATSNVVHEKNDLRTRTITTSTIVVDTTFAGQKAWRVRRQTALQLSGTQTQQNDQLTVSGDGSGDGMYYIGVNGIYLGSTASQKMNMTVKSQGGSVPVVQTATSTVEIAH
jgi:hypothetical protein